MEFNFKTELGVLSIIKPWQCLLRARTSPEQAEQLRERIVQGRSAAMMELKRQCLGSIKRSIMVAMGCAWESYLIFISPVSTVAEAEASPLEAENPEPIESCFDLASCDR